MAQIFLFDKWTKKVQILKLILHLFVLLIYLIISGLKKT